MFHALVDCHVRVEVQWPRIILMMRGDFSSQLTKMFSFVQTTKENQISIVGSNRSVIDLTLCYGYGEKRVQFVSQTVYTKNLSV